jgi:hypothetical protein
MKKAKREKVINPKLRIYLFSKENPKGEIFSFINGRDSDEYKAMLEKGYFASPAQLNLPKEGVDLTTEQVQKMRPEDLKAVLESYGFIVLTPEQLKAEANKLIDAVIDIKDFTDEALLNEAVRRGLKDGEHVEEGNTDGTEGFINTSAINDKEDLLAKFKLNAKSLTKEEHIILGKTLGLSLRINFGEDTMITKINEVINAE